MMKPGKKHSSQEWWMLFHIKKTLFPLLKKSVRFLSETKNLLQNIYWLKNQICFAKFNR